MNLRVAALAALLVVEGCTGVVPSPAASPTSTPDGTLSGPSPVETSVSASPNSTPGSTPTPWATAPPSRIFSAFTTPPPIGAETAWAGIHWQKLQASDPIAQVQSVVAWAGGWVARGLDVSSGAGGWTPLWISHDGSHWQPSAPFGLTTIVLGVAPVGSELVALTSATGTACDGSDTCWFLAPPLLSWTSSDGTTWTPHPAPDLYASWRQAGGLPADSSVKPAMAGGPRGVVAAVHGGDHPTVAVSPDGIAWQVLPADTLPARFDFWRIVWTDAGFVGTGTIMRADGGLPVGTMTFSTDGRSWATSALPCPDCGDGAVSAGNLFSAENGMIAAGHSASIPGVTIWWWSADGRRWQILATPESRYQPLGVWPGEGEGAGGEAYGALLGDGDRIIAYRPAPDTAAWTSADGRTWLRVPVTGELPSAGQIPALLLPGGLVVTSDAGSWIGAAVPR